MIRSGISVDCLSIDFDSDWIDYINELKKMDIKELKTELYYNGSINYLPIVFDKQSAAVFAHEVFGHMLEADNYFNYDYEKYLDNISSFKLNITDDPYCKRYAGYYIFDDALIPAKKTVLFKEGKFTGSLIGGSYDRKIINSSLRRETYSDRLLPRMSNFFVISEEKCDYPLNYIRADKMGKCLVDHKNGKIIFYIESAFHIENGYCISKIKPFSISITFEDVFSKTLPINAGSLRAYPLQCQKQNQIVNCGAMSTNWIYNP